MNEIKPVNILVVDDESDVEDIFLQVFQNEIDIGIYHFSFALNGIEALSIIQKNGTPQIIITDIKMPQMDGITLLSKVQDVNRQCKTIVLSAYGDMNNIRSAMNTGACEFITKPINMDDLKKTLNKVVGQYQEMVKMSEMEKSMITLKYDIQIAAEIQQEVIPTNFESMPFGNKYELYGEMIPAMQVSGDFYDFFEINDTHIALVIADVTGKGIPASFLMAVSRTVIHTIGLELIVPSEVIKKTNQFLFQNNKKKYFVSAFYAILNTLTGELTYCNAGHNPPYIISEDGKLKTIGETSGVVLGIHASLPENDEEYQNFTIQLNKNDLLLLYTDGAFEIFNEVDEIWGENHFKECVINNRNKTLPALVQSIHEEIFQFLASNIPTDDVTLLALRKLV